MTILFTLILQSRTYWQKFDGCHRWPNSVILGPHAWNPTLSPRLDSHICVTRLLSYMICNARLVGILQSSNLPRNCFLSWLQDASINCHASSSTEPNTSCREATMVLQAISALKTPDPQLASAVVAGLWVLLFPCGDKNLIISITNVYPVSKASCFEVIQNIFQMVKSWSPLFTFFGYLKLIPLGANMLNDQYKFMVFILLYD